MELDEIGNADGAEIRRMPSCMLDFELVPPAASDEVSFDALFRFSGFGEQTRDFVLDKAYPKLHETLETILETGRADPTAAHKIWAEAVEIELARVRPEPIVTADTELGHRLQDQLGMSSIVANSIVCKGGKQLLESMETRFQDKAMMEMGQTAHRMYRSRVALASPEQRFTRFDRRFTFKSKAE